MARKSLISRMCGTSELGDLPHVLLVIDQLPKNLGGGERALLLLASLLPLHGFRVSILTFCVHPECPAIRDPRCPIYVLPLHRACSLEGLRCAVHLRRFLREQNIEIVQTFFESSDLWAGFLTKITSRAKLIWSRRDMGILRARKHRMAYRFMSRLPDAVLAVSEQVRQYSILVDHIKPPRVHTIYNGIRLDEFAHIPRFFNLSREVMVTTVGNIRRVKGHDLFIRAAAMIARDFPKTRFSIAGEILEEKFFHELRLLVDSLGLSDRFCFVGGVADLPRFLSDADVFVLPSRSEGFSNALIEAMAAGLPAIATRVGGNCEAIEDGISGLLVAPEDPSALADAMRGLLADRYRAIAMGEAARRSVTSKFSADTLVNRTVEVYSQLLAMQGAGLA